MSAPKKPPTSAKPTSAAPPTVESRLKETTDANKLGQAKVNMLTTGEVSGAPASGQDNTISGLGTGWDEEAVVNAIMSGDHFQQNLSNKFNNLAYHWRLFCMPDRDYAYEGGGIKTDILEVYAALDAAPQIIIAETGASGYNIGEVTMKTVMGDVSSRGGIATDITMKINEPNGVSFMDSLQQAARSAGVVNYLDFFYYLELTFKGYDKDGSINLNPFPELPNGGRWIWTVKINDIDVQLGSGGGAYKLTMIPMANHPMTAEYGHTIDTTTIKAETVGEFFEQLGTQLTDSWKRRMFVRGKDGYITHQFKIHGVAGNGEQPPSQGERQTANANALFNNMDIMTASTADGTQSAINTELTDEQLALEARGMAANGIPASAIENMSLRPKEEDFSSVRGQLGFDKTGSEGAAGSSGKDATANSAGVPTATLGRGHYIPDIVNMVMATAEEAQKLAKDSSQSATADADDEKFKRINNKEFRECLTWQVIPEVKFKNDDFHYDHLTNRYGRTIVWHIYPRIDQEPILSELQIRQAFGDNASGIQKKMIAALAKRGFLPKRYDYLFTGMNTEVLNFDLGFNFAWSVNLPRFEAYYNTQRLPQALVDETKTLLSYEELDAQEDAIRLELSAEVKELIRRRDAGELNAEELEEFNKKYADWEKQKEARDKALEQGYEVRKQAEERAKAAMEGVPSEQDYRREFVENILDRERKNAAAQSGSIVPRIPFSWGAGDQAKQDAGLGGTGQWHLGRQLYGAVLNQVYGPTTSRFQQVDMTIRGDPFWIGQGTFEDAIDHNKDVVENLDSRGLAYNMMGQQCFLFRFKYPVDVDDSGTIMLKDNETVTGIYKVTEVKNSFVGGQFTQDIHAVRLILHDVFKSILGVQDNSDESGAQAQQQAKPPEGTP